MCRRFLIRNPQEEKTFHEVTAAKDWARDDKYELAGYPVSLDVLVEEHKARLKSLIDQDLLEVTETSGGTAPRDADTDAESA